MAGCYHKVYELEQCHNGWIVRLHNELWVFPNQESAITKLTELVNETRCWECDSAGNHIPEGQ